MKRRWGVIAAIALILGFGVYWLTRGPTAVVELDGRALSDVVDLTCFGPLRPDMGYPQVEALVKEARRAHATRVEHGGSRKLEHWEISRTYPGDSGVLAPCPDGHDAPGTPVQYVPDDMTMGDFFKAPVSVDSGTRYIEIRNSGRNIMRIALQDGDAVEDVRWYLPE